jgi:Ca2+/H+ antiporter
MKTHPRIQLISKLLLLISVLAINALPFWIAPRATYEVVFLVMSGILAEVCLVSAWLIYGGATRIWERGLWSFMLLLAAWMATTGLMGGSLTGNGGMRSILLGVTVIIPSAVLCIVIFAVAKFCTKTQANDDSLSRTPSGQLRLRQLCAIVAMAAYLSLLGRQLVTHHRPGWLQDIGSQGFRLLFVHGDTMGLLIAPCALVILKPSRWSPLWLVYALIIFAVEPIAEQLLSLGFQIDAFRKMVWPDSYMSVVIDNITWYGPQLLPTVVLIVLLRLTGFRVEKKK